MTHSRACPKCGKIVPWTRGKKNMHPKYGVSYDMHLVCPEHGEFRNPAEAKALKKINKETHRLKPKRHLEEPW